MTEETIIKRDRLIKHFGSVEKYQSNIFDKVPAIFIMTCDDMGNVVVDNNSVGRYIQREMDAHSITIEQLIERDKKTFDKVIDDYYNEVFPLLTQLQRSI